MPELRKPNARAMNNLGLMYAKGQGVVQDYAEAVKWWHKAAEQGDAEAMNSLGDMYAKGWGVAQDLVLALWAVRLRRTRPTLHGPKTRPPAPLGIPRPTCYHKEEKRGWLSCTRTS